MLKPILVAGCFIVSSFSFRIIPAAKISKRELFSTSDITSDLEKCLYREYSSFFNPMEKNFYDQNVQFVDPLVNFFGIDKYQANVDMLGGRNALGSVLFKDASINLHSISKIGDNKLMTRWTLRFTVKALPWQPRPIFTGVSIYTLNSSGKIIKQDDYWDSVNLKTGEYKKASFFDGLGDFLNQIQSESGAEMAAPELPFELLRRAERYDVRRYPAYIAAETEYDQRTEGYDRLGSFVSYSNENGKGIPFYTPTIMSVRDESNIRTKLMTWPLKYRVPNTKTPLSTDDIPSPTIEKIALKIIPQRVVAVSRFERAATEPVVRGYTKQLVQDIELDGLVPTSAVKAGDCLICQYDALFSLYKRRNEVWVELEDHPWKQ